jgi:hypothetical protein
LHQNAPAEFDLLRFHSLSSSVGSKAFPPKGLSASSGATAEQVMQLIERRRALLAAMKELVARPKRPGGAKTGQSADLKQWADSLPRSAKAKRDSQAFIDCSVLRGLKADTVAGLEKASVGETLAHLRTMEQAVRRFRFPTGRRRCWMAGPRV